MSDDLGGEDLERICGNCNNMFPAEMGGSDYGVCLNDPDYEPYIDRLLANDFGCCAGLLAHKRFQLDRTACSDFSPMDMPGNGSADELIADIKALDAKGQLTGENVKIALAVDAARKTDWSTVQADGYIQRLHAASTIQTRDEALNGLGFLSSRGNNAAFDALCIFFRKLPPAQKPDDCHLRSVILRHIWCGIERKREVAKLLVEDLLRTPSNQQTRSWFTEVFRCFEGCSPEVAEEALLPILDSPRFSYRIKRRVKDIIGFGIRQ